MLMYCRLRISKSSIITGAIAELQIHQTTYHCFSPKLRNFSFISWKWLSLFYYGSSASTFALFSLYSTPPHPHFSGKLLVTKPGLKTKTYLNSTGLSCRAAKAWVSNGDGSGERHWDWHHRYKRSRPASRHTFICSITSKAVFWWPV